MNTFDFCVIYIKANGIKKIAWTLSKRCKSKYSNRESNLFAGSRYRNPDPKYYTILSSRLVSFTSRQFSLGVCSVELLNVQILSYSEASLSDHL